MSSYTSVCFNI